MVLFRFSCRGHALVAYAKPQQRKKNNEERGYEEGDKIKIFDAGFETRQVFGI